MVGLQLYYPSIYYILLIPVQGHWSQPQLLTSEGRVIPGQSISGPHTETNKKKQIDLASPQLIHSCVHATRLTFLSNEAACKTTLGTSLVYLAPAEINRHKCERKISIQTGLLVKHHKSARKGEKSNSASTELKPLTACECWWCNSPPN